MSQNTALNGAARSGLKAWGRYAAAIVLALGLLGGAGFLRAPEAALDALRDAAVHRDAAALAQHLDGPALRHSLGRLLLQQMGVALPDDAGNDRQLMGQFIIAGALVKPLVETLVTPDGIAALLDGQVAPRRSLLPGADPQSRPQAKIRLAWSDLSTVRGTVMTSTGDGALVLVLQRQGLTWRLAGVEASAGSVRLAPP
jgi:hypothetical protein